MIESYRFDGFCILEKKDDKNYYAILSLFFDEKIERNLIQKGSKGEVWKVRHDGVCYALKINRPTNKIIGRKVKALLKGSYFSSLILRVDKARAEECFSMCDVYLVAEKKHFRFARESFVLMEWIDGPLLSDSEELRNKYKNEVGDLLKNLHQHGISSGDVHPGNFIVSNAGLKIIDLSGRGASAIDRAKDFIGLKNKFGVEADVNSWAISLVLLRSKLRAFLKKARVS
ncbi:lipopolysaccharide core heptose(II) kinase RfaY [Vogesella indigofera]|uniref:Lipopolysaccharide core heptose(II) kinase RfaY n=1 Tax=Vogesella indigofera TaxID=45465 RepID=A0ABT5I6Y6_VOGIN|nr:lipopolysaccharide core heptose(II) kinase RfaY [Vogesella indigofera]MDC7691935.1 lipopolysaccharide core heptose(II) kinase RfaY [Vogesella indigofera]